MAALRKSSPILCECCHTLCDAIASRRVTDHVGAQARVQSGLHL